MSASVFPRERVQATAASLAARGVFVGTSSWKYPGWCDQLYETARYETKGKFVEARFNRNCLFEYAQVFKTVCVDAAYYAFPSEKYLDELLANVPADFQFGFKVTDEITVKRFPTLPRFGGRGGMANPNYLHPELFANSFLKPCEKIRPHVGILMFEFSRFYPADYAKGAEFIEDLRRFFRALPRGWPYGIEIRNKHWLTPEYFACLAECGVAHVFNSWEAMPPIDEQLKMPGCETCPDLSAARFLLAPGRKYEEAKKTFSPYNKTHEVNERARAAGKSLIQRGLQKGGRTFIFVNNRLEGNALATIAAMTEGIE